MIQDSDKLHAALDRETRGLVIGPSPLEEMMRVGAQRRVRRRVALVSGAAALAALPAAVLAFGGWPGGDADVGPGRTASSTPPTTPATTGPVTPPTSATSPAQPGSSNRPSPNDRIVVLGSGTFQGRPWRLVRDRYIISEAADQEPVRNPSTVEHLPFSEYGKPGTVACEALGFQFGDAAPGTPSDYDVGGACTPQSLNPDPFATPKRFDPQSGGNPSDKTTGKPTFLYAIGYGPAAGINGSTATSAALTVDGVTGERQPLLKMPGESVAYYAFLVPGASNRNPQVTVTFYDAHGNRLRTMDAKYPAPPG